MVKVRVRQHKVRVSVWFRVGVSVRFRVTMR